MIDIEKIKATSSLARSLVDKGFATNIEEACMLIERQGLVDYGDKIPFTERQREVLASEGIEFTGGAVEVTQVQSQEGGKRMDANEFTRRLERVEVALYQMKDFFDKYSKNNDNNLREVDASVKKLKLQVSGMKAAGPSTQSTLEPQVQQQSQASSSSRSEAGERNGALGGINPRDFAVERIFSNANNQMMGKIK